VSTFDLLEGKVSSLVRRVEALEGLARARAAASGDELEAQITAELIGFSVDVLVLPECIEERQRLARRLRLKGWSFERISRVLGCCEKSVRRWTNQS